MNRKAQVGSVEMMLALVLFLAIFGAVYFFFSYLSLDYITQGDENIEQTEFTQAHTQLFYTQGHPHNWEELDLSTNIPTFIGLRGSDNQISIEKLTQLAAQNDTYYDLLLDTMGFVQTNTNVTLNTYYFSGTALIENTSLAFGVPSVDYSSRKKVEEFFGYNGDLYVVRMEVYYE